MPDQKINLRKKGFILAYSLRRYSPLQWGRQKLRPDQMNYITVKKQSVNTNQSWAVELRGPPFSFSKALPPKGSATFSNTVASWEPTVVTHRPWGGSRAPVNHSRPQLKASSIYACLLTRTWSVMKISWDSRCPLEEELGQHRRQPL